MPEDYTHARVIPSTDSTPPQLWLRGPNGPEMVPELLRHQAAVNLRNEPEKLRQVITMIGEEQARLRYPEAFPDLDPQPEEALDGQQ